MPNDTVLLAVNGTLMRGLELNPNMIAAGASFVAEARTAACYRIWSIGDRHPGMVRTRVPSGTVTLELWAVPPAGLAGILIAEPAGLAVGKVLLDDGREVLGVLAEPWLTEGEREITEFGGWRAYTAAVAAPSDRETRS